MRTIEVINLMGPNKLIELPITPFQIWKNVSVDVFNEVNDIKKRKNLSFLNEKLSICRISTVFFLKYCYFKKSIEVYFHWTFLNMKKHKMKLSIWSRGWTIKSLRTHYLLKDSSISKVYFYPVLDFKCISTRFQKFI